MSIPYNQTIAPCGTKASRRRHLRHGEQCETCEPSAQKLAPCGTPSARDRHRRRGETCNACKPQKQNLAPCGTYAARKRHRRANETCNACGPIGVPRKPLAPCGTDPARRRHRKRGETCQACVAARKTPELQPCGTPAAWRRHKRRNEDPCEPCTTAIRASNNARKARLYGAKPRTGMTNLEALVAEVVFLLNAGEGEARILDATGYTGRPASLRSRLQKAGRHDLATRVLNPWELAA